MRYVRVLKEEPAPRVKVYEEEFFRASDLMYVAVKDRALAKDHLISRLDEAPTIGLLRSAEGLGQWVGRDDVTRYVDAFLRLATWRHTEEIGELARARFEDEARRTSGAIDPTIIKRLEAWTELFSDKDDSERREIVAEIKAWYETFEDIPF